MMKAAIKGHVEIVQLLLNAGASVNDKDTSVLSQCVCISFFSLYDIVILHA